MNSYLFLFLMCFIPLATHRYARTQPHTTPIFSSLFRAPEPPPPPPASILSLLYRLYSSMKRPSPSYSYSSYSYPEPPHPPPSSEYIYFASPPVVKRPHRPAPRSWLSSSTSKRERRPPPQMPKQTYYRRAPLSSYAAARNAQGVITLTAFLGTEGSNVDVDMVVLMAHLQAACKHIAAVLSSPKEMQYSSSDYESSSLGGRERHDPRSLRILSVGAFHSPLLLVLVSQLHLLSEFVCTIFWSLVTGFIIPHIKYIQSLK